MLLRYVLMSFTLFTRNELEKASSKINVKSIILEEEGHLEEMINQLKSFSPDWEFHANKAVEMESRLFTQWVGQLSAELKLSTSLLNKKGLLFLARGLSYVIIIILLM